MYFIVVIALFSYGNAWQELTSCQYTSWYSEKDRFPADLRSAYPMVGLSCRGEFCAQLKEMQCSSVTEDIDGSGRNYDLHGSDCEALTTTFSDETGDAGLSCPDGMYVDRMECASSSKHCDNIGLRCCTNADWFVDSSNVTETDWFSNDASRRCPDMSFVIGGACKGYYCDEMKLHCAPISGPV